MSVWGQSGESWSPWQAAPVGVGSTRTAYQDFWLHAGANLVPLAASSDLESEAGAADVGGHAPAHEEIALGEGQGRFAHMWKVDRALEGEAWDGQMRDYIKVEADSQLREEGSSCLSGNRGAVSPPVEQAIP